MEPDQLETPADEFLQVDAHTIRARQSLRDAIANDLEEFLNNGGSVKTVEANLRADPPRPPQNNYGKGSI